MLLNEGLKKMGVREEPTDMEAPTDEAVMSEAAPMDYRNVDIREEREWAIESGNESPMEERSYEESGMMSGEPREVLRGSYDNENAAMRRI